MLKQYFLINKDLKMGTGKIAVQIAHGEVMYMQKVMSKNNRMKFYKWKSETSEDPIGMMKKIVVKSTENEMRDMFMKLHDLGIWSYLIFDKGLTQVEPNSLTCLVVEPLEESQYKDLFGDLKLL